MLVLSRKCNQQIQIGSNIEVKVISIQGNRVRLGINCPAEMRILRAELPPMGDLNSIPRYTWETSELNALR